MNTPTYIFSWSRFYVIPENFMRNGGELIKYRKYYILSVYYQFIFLVIFYVYLVMIKENQLHINLKYVLIFT